MTSSAASTCLHKLEPLLPGLFATRPEFPFGDSHSARAFILYRRGDGTCTSQSVEGNVLLYASSHISDYTDHVKELGQPSHQLLTHRDEASEACNVLDAKVFCHRDERASIEAKGSRVDETFEGPERQLGDDLTAYHAPGHTPGVAIYCWRRPGADGSDESILFTGDTLYGTADGGLDYAPFFLYPYAEKKRDYGRTLELIRRLRPSFIVPGLSAGKFVFPYEDGAIEMLQQKVAGEN